MMNKLAFISLIFAVTISAQAQSVKHYTISPKRTVQIDPTRPDTSVYIKNIEAPSPGGETERQQVARLKQINAGKYPRRVSAKSGHGTGNIDTDTSLVIDYSDGANPYNFRVPSDNSLAISDSGMIVSCINSSYYFYNTTLGNVAGNGALISYAKPGAGSVYDPKMIYDPKEDKFIMVMLKDFSSVDTNEIIVAFSSTHNPLDPWYVFELTGNPFDTTQWSDYPAIAITDDELFITVNLLGDGEPWQTGFKQSVIWQADKHDGFANQPLDVNLWSDIRFDTTATSFIRNLHPIRNYNHYISDDSTTHAAVANQYFLSNRNFALESDSIFLIEITNTMNNSPNINISLIHSTDHYFLPVNGLQTSGTELATNDGRVLGAVINPNTDMIQFVQNTTDTTYGTAAIYHGTIQNVSTTPTCFGHIISDSIRDFGYPNIASSATTATDNSVIIAFNHTSSQDFPGHSAILYQNTGNYSDILELRTGNGYIQALNQAVERWGDYSGIQRRYNEPGKVWFEGIYGTSNRRYGNWISELYDKDNVIHLPEPPVDNIKDAAHTSNVKLFPNPTEDIVSFYFTIENTDNVVVSIYDLSGKKMADIYSGTVKAGENFLSLNTSFLAKGMYNLVLTDTKGKSFFTKKLVRN